MGVQVINTEFSGDPNQPEICEEMFYRSMEELLPIFEREVFALRSSPSVGLLPKRTTKPSIS
ncbi:Uncharacterised protein [Raoultella terrigena]|uniref:Uncharacterized protein n=1 Tax=Raoultella terrigena TaxID=577 RepID=A0A4U9D4W6_RAOTE|nr:Uncharacterised protein [Raoultella terrigena]